MAKLPDPAPWTQADAATFMAQEARKYEDVALAELRDGASPKRVSFTRRIGAYYEAAAVALGHVKAPETPLGGPPIEGLYVTTGTPGSGLAAHPTEIEDMLA
jgi:hypothetical protein